MTHDRPAPDVRPGSTSPVWGPSVWERSARLPYAAGAQPALTAVWLLAAERLRAAVAVVAARSRRRGDRGDVPGWVLVTLMTAGLVLVLWGIARDRLTEVFNHAIDSVLGGG